MNFDFISSIKDFFFDIVGFLIPGFVLLVITNVIFHVDFPFQLDEIIAFVISYVLGYVVFSISLVKGLIISKDYKFIPAKSKEKAESELMSQDTFILAKELINSKVEKNGKKLDRLHSLRNIAMSQTPDADKKVYTFIFRAELFDQLHTIVILSLIVSIVMLVLSLLKIYTAFGLLNYVMIGVFLFLIMTLRKGWIRFYKIAMNLPFSLYITNQTHES